MSTEPVLVLFAKKPVKGRVKTRLSPPLNTSQATQVAMMLIEQSVKRAYEYWPGKIELCLWPDLEDEFIQDLEGRYKINLAVQCEGDLGEKMYAAMNNKKVVNQVALIMGCDVPHCSKEIFLKAFIALETNKNVIGPTSDGGYYCIGVNHPQSLMFENVDWGSRLAFKQTLQSCKSGGIEFELSLPELRDLDTYDDLVVLSKQFSALRPFLISGS